MNGEHYRELERLFVELVDLPMTQRADRLEQITADIDLRQGVQRLLEENDRLESDEFMRAGALGEDLEILQVPAETSRPDRVGDYAILRLLGRGASGTVYLARSPLPLERLVALKLLNQDASQSTLARFVEEQRVLARLQHEGIAEVFDEGFDASGRPFTVLEYIEGKTLTEHCESERLDWRAITQLMSQCCSAVSHAHQRNIIHRDIKPSNLMVANVEGKSCMKVIDFGTAKLSDPLRMMAQLTVEAQFLGTLPYSSPEQLAGNDAPDIRTDVHALGIVFFECLERKHPFYHTGLGLKAIIDRVMGTPLPALSPNPNRPNRELDAILAKACAKEPSQRYSSLMHFGEDLHHLLIGLPVLAMRPRPAYIARKFARRHRVPLALALVIFLLLAFATGMAIDSGIQANRSREALRAIAIGLVDDLMPKLADLNGSSEARLELGATLSERLDELLEATPRDQELLLRKANVLEFRSDIRLSNNKVEQSHLLREEASQIIQELKSGTLAPSRTLLADERRITIKLGDIAKARKNYPQAQGLYQQAHALLLAAEGDQRESLCWSFERLSWIAMKLGNGEEDLSLAESRLQLSDALLKENQASAPHLHNSASAHKIMAEKLITRSRFEGALAHAILCIELANELMLLEPNLFSSNLQRIHANAVHSRALFHVGRYADSQKQLDRLYRLTHQWMRLNPGRKDVYNITNIQLSMARSLFIRMGQVEKANFLGREMNDQFPDKNPTTITPIPMPREQLTPKPTIPGAAASHKG